MCNKFLIILMLETLLFYECVSQFEEYDICQTNEKLIGSCLLDWKCLSVMRDLKNYGVKPTICGFVGLSSLVCCPFDSAERSKFTDRISVRKCEGFKYCYQGIVLGQVAGSLEFPHMAAVGWPLIGGGYSWNCGGTLISEKFVLTAGHCTRLSSTQLSSETPTVVKLGDVDLRNNNANGTVPIRRIIPHPNYTSPSRYHDIALLLLERYFNPGIYIKPACLWTSPELPTEPVIATGWGATQYMGSPSDLLQKVNVTVVNQDICRRPFSRDRRLPNGLIDGQLCAGDPKGGDTCQGDSGGPLQIRDHNPPDSCRSYVLAVTSYGRNCGTNIPAVYTKVSFYLDWIESVVWPQ